MAKNEEEMSFLEHLEVLRWHIMKAFLSVFIMAIVAFIFKDFIFTTVILGPKSPEFPTNVFLCEVGKMLGILKLCINSLPLEIISIKMAGQFSMHIMVSLIAGLIVAFPYVFYQFWSFVVPAMHSKEKRYSRGAVVYSSLLFILGVLFGYYIISPLTVHFLGSYSVSPEVTNQINLISYVSTLASVILASGIIFELPVLAYFLTKAGLITPEFMRKYRKHSLVVILVLSAIITPPDIFSQILVSLPLIVLYEVGIMISNRIVKAQKKEEARREKEK
ncbi:MAG: twin-arginine translocase subunit TatC [Bacteroidales bacterium]|nr:twin-arginine translocase subunit TatC [Bacteroidales bacterium]MCF8406205.1 twin-arginine translocase subunit TatC [Bacteroidales bacterium]